MEARNKSSKSVNLCGSKKRRRKGKAQLDIIPFRCGRGRPFVEMNASRTKIRKSDRYLRSTGTASGTGHRYRTPVRYITSPSGHGISVDKE